MMGKNTTSPSAVSICHGRLLDPANHLDEVNDLHLQDGKILAIGTPPDGFNAELRIDARHQIVCPGLVDLRFRVREPGHENKGTIATETRAATAGGVTSLCCPPDTDPVIDTTAVIELIRLKAQIEGLANVHTLAALTQQLKGEKLSEMRELKDAGCVGVSNALQPIFSTLVMRRALEYAASHDITVFIHANDPWLSNHGCAHEGGVSARLGLTGIPESAETIAIARDLQLIELAGVKAHFCQLSCAKSVEMIKQARTQGLAVSADVTAHHLHLTEMDVGYFDSNCHVLPPLRSQRDQEALRQGLLDNTICSIVSDHQPHNHDAKLAPFAETEAGISAVETLLPLALRMSHESGMQLSEVISRLTIQPARILNIPEGTLSIGRNADICIFDPEHYWRVDREQFFSQGKNTPFHGWELKGRVTYTIKSGQVVFSLSDLI